MTLDPQIIALAFGLWTSFLRLPAYWDNREERHEYEARVAVIAVSTAIVVSEAWPGQNGRWRMAMALGSLTYGETRWSKKVHDGTIVGDNGKAACLGQLHETAKLPREEWLILSYGGTDIEATTACMRATRDAFFSSFRFCRSNWDEEGVAKAYTAYGTGFSCDPKPWAISRATRWANLVYGKMPSGNALTAMNMDSYPLLGVEHERVKELPSLLGPPSGTSKTPFGFTSTFSS